ncbi:bifunctional hydroxymethylpyrimidine kinase/phosphomethylpyrimidine kinase [Crocinitomicaceae bacterium CZZ-1]|uniref:hydroxymethylpyrimidine kinase n=1 Tax=Taishania pollutisoli TaxID=2766479 RepID=A0A8J6PD26_9FLAO|nr:bifunctional hydroxymethylpyrimidine kinase/phosphomethylpyrimidine kinase [Taishania pollutisoli]MBC9810985.1 bifunctional hydroxymethylpyrimidine kinase/phosphomethylpyrimidine kinase [Taishania pollutisoli]NGF76623.1 bifunctional hydroxymethylpyrimidine kinase/phosphomethylpyrimidine kinase [Fluviicola sp. SGL-29]
MTHNKQYKTISVLSIAGFDGSGGAGIQADTKTISSLGCYATNVLTALPVQNTQGVQTIFEIPGIAIDQQITSIMDDIYPDAIKIGMVHSVELVEIIAKHLRNYTGPVVFDPVMISTSGHQLIKDETIDACKTHLFPLATLITPNLDEVSVLVNKKISTVEQMEEAGKQIVEMGTQAVLVKGGHLQQEELTSFLVRSNQPTEQFKSQRIASKNTHGSGCTLSSAIASYLAQGYSLSESVKQAQAYIQQAIETSKDLIIGKGNGPLNHFFDPKKLILKTV